MTTYRRYAINPYGANITYIHYPKSIPQPLLYYIWFITCLNGMPSGFIWHLTNTSQTPRKHLTNTSKTPHKHLTNTSQTPHKLHLKNTSKTPHKHLTNTSQTPHKHLTNTSQTLHKRLTNTSKTPQKHLTNTVRCFKILNIENISLQRGRAGVIGRPIAPVYPHKLWKYCGLHFSQPTTLEVVEVNFPPSSSSTHPPSFSWPLYNP